VENKPAGATETSVELAGAAKADQSANSRRRRNGNGDDAKGRYFLPRAGSSPAKPELGQEMASEGEALVEAFRNGQHFYMLIPYKAVTEVRGGSPVIVKQAVTRT
jgi:hypothetical protein